MGAILSDFRARGVTLRMRPGGQLEVEGPLNDELRTTIRLHRAAIISELSTARDGNPDPEDQELRKLVAIVSANWPADEKAEALAWALADCDNALRRYRALVEERRSGQSFRDQAA